VEIAGSFRRGKSSLKDLDVVAAGDAETIRTHMESKGYKFLNEGKVRMRVEVPLQEPGTFIEADISVTNNEEFGCALLHWTGSKEFNVALRSHAKRRGFSINEHCMSNISNPDNIFQVYPPDEQTVFAILGIQYVEPRDRLNFSSIKLL
jgi:DNA polymerase (family 10)